MPSGAWESLHGGSRKWFPEQCADPSLKERVEAWRQGYRSHTRASRRPPPDGPCPPPPPLDRSQTTALPCDTTLIVPCSRRYARRGRQSESPAVVSLPRSQMTEVAAGRLRHRQRVPDAGSAGSEASRIGWLIGRICRAQVCGAVLRSWTGCSANTSQSHRAGQGLCSGGKSRGMYADPRSTGRLHVVR
jgi:hypothetical protein